MVNRFEVIKAARFAVYVAIMIWQKNQNPITKTRPANVLGVLSGPESEVNYSAMDGQQQKIRQVTSQQL